MAFIDNSDRFMKPNFSNSSISALSSALKKLDLISPPPLPIDDSKQLDTIWKERGKQDRVQNIVMIIADSLGISNIRETGILSNYLDKGLEVDTSFPTMTSTNMASLSHVQYPSTHGLVGYNFYHEKVNGIFNALNCKTKIKNSEISIDKLNLTKQDIIKGENIFTLMDQHAQLCMQELYYELWVPDLFDMGGLPKYLFGDIPSFAYDSFDQKPMLQDLYHQLFNSRSLNLIAIYYPQTDIFSHLYTAQSKEFFMAMKSLESLIKALERHPTVTMGETAIIVTSDHGQVPLPTGDQNIKVSKKQVQEHSDQGFSIGTSGRTLHVYYKDEHGERNAENYLHQYFSNEKNGIILDQQEASGLLGPIQPTDIIKQRLGQKVVLLDEGFYLDYPEVVRFGQEKELKAQHGGLSYKELKVPFLII